MLLALPDPQIVCRKWIPKIGIVSGSPTPVLRQETHEEAAAPAKSCKNASDARANYFGWSSKDGFLFTPSPPIRPPIFLSNRSLELCSEMLGNETGTSCNHVFDESIPSSSSSLANPTRKLDQLRKLERKQQQNDFPPL